MKAKRYLCGLLAAAMCLSLCACGGKTDDAAAGTPAATAAPTPVPTPRPARRDSETADKEETVYVKALADGRAYDITVETLLTYAGDGEHIEDVSYLSDIKNTEGDEDFDQGLNGALTWDDHGERIRYEGKSAKALPVNVRLSWFLDGEEISPYDLVGKSGHLRMRIDYDNDTAETVTVVHADLSEEDDEDGGDEPDESERRPKGPVIEEVETPIPFLAVSLIMLSEDVFSNVRMTNGRLVSLGDRSIAVGYALPGLDGALSLRDLELTEDARIPGYVELEADVTDFSLDFTATILSNGMFDEVQLDTLDDLEKLSDGMDKLMEAAEKLTDGAGELADGADEFASAVVRYVDGVGQVGDGADGVSQGLEAVNEQLDPVRTGVRTVYSALDTLRGQLGADTPDLSDAASALEVLIDGIDTLQNGLDSLWDYAYAADASIDAALAELNSYAPDVYAALDGLDLTDDQRAQVIDAVGGVMAEADAAVANARMELAGIPALPSDPNFAGYINAVSDGATALRAQASAALGGLSGLPSDPGAALDRIEEVADGVTALCDAIDRLSEGAAALSEGASALAENGNALASAADALASGAGELTDGLETFSEEGIRELTDKAGDELVTLVTQVRALREADLVYDNFGGIADGRTGSVRFIIETDGLGV